MRLQHSHYTTIAALLLFGAIACDLSAQEAAQTTLTKPKPVETSPKEETVVLSPFEVVTAKDKGYMATNSTSGTRLNLEVKDLPLNLEVITSEFIRDTGAHDLRQALRYSAGVVLDSQADAFVEVDGNPQGAGSNDPRGATRRVGDSTTKMRGFVIEDRKSVV